MRIRLFFVSRVTGSIAEHHRRVVPLSNFAWRLTCVTEVTVRLMEGVNGQALASRH
jgi:hypothetical protein